MPDTTNPNDNTGSNPSPNQTPNLSHVPQAGDPPQTPGQVQPDVPLTDSSSNPQDRTPLPSPLGGSRLNQPTGQLPNPPDPQAGPAAPAQQQSQQDEGSDDDPDDDGSQDIFSADYVKSLRREAKKYRLELRETQKQLEEKQTEEEKAKVKKLREQQKWQELAEQREKELAEKDAKIAQMQNDIELGRRETLIMNVAAEMQAHNTTDPNFGYLLDEEDLYSNDPSVTRQNLLKEMQTLQQQKPYLFQEVQQPNNQQLGQNPQEINGQTPQQQPATPKLQKFSPAGQGQSVRSDADRLNDLQRRMGQRSTVFASGK